jgi:carbon-monoxide dehydrogenase medium subunit
MLLPRFEFRRPASLKEACRILADYGGGAKVLAGGTDLLVNMKRKVLTPDCVVSLDNLDELAAVESSKTEVSIGPAVTASRLSSDRTIGLNIPVLASAAGKIGSPLIRNLATIGGNVANARPAADTAPPLMVLEARVVLTSVEGERDIPIDQFFVGPGETVMRPDEIISRIIVPKTADRCGGGYEKLGLRKALEIAIVNAAVFVVLTPNGQKIKAARVALGAVGPTPLRSPAAETALTGSSAGPKVLDKAAAAAIVDSCAIDDHRGTADYRCQMVEVLTRRALETALAAARA